MESLVSTEWLAKELGASDLRVVDASWHLPGSGRDAAAEYEAGHIPGAVFMDLRELVDSNSSLPNTLPPAEKFATHRNITRPGEVIRVNEPAAAQATVPPAPIPDPPTVAVGAVQPPAPAVPGAQ